MGVTGMAARFRAEKIKTSMNALSSMFCRNYVTKTDADASASASAASSATELNTNLKDMLSGLNLKKDVSQLIARTPMVHLSKLTEGFVTNVVAKLEMMQPCWSVKDRVGYDMILDADEKGLISPEKSVLVEPTFGNMGIVLSYISVSRGYELVLTIPSYTSLERRVTMRACSDTVTENIEKQ